MHEELIRKVIRTKIKIGMHILEELPTPIQQQAQQILNILQEEPSCLSERTRAS